MSELIKSNTKNPGSTKTSGFFASATEAAKAKNVGLIAQVKKIGLKIIKTGSSK